MAESLSQMTTATRANGKMTSLSAMVFILGSLDRNTLVSFLMVSRMVSVLRLITQKMCTRVNGKQDEKMAKAK
jgi:hypothetical protein